MSKFTESTKGKTITTVNAEGAVAYKITDEKLKLVTQVLTSFFKEPKFYGDNSNDLVKNIRTVLVKDPQFIAQLAIFAREQLHMRSTAQVLAAELAHVAKGDSFVKDAITRVCSRVDDTYEVLGYYMATHGKPVPNSIKKGLAGALANADKYQLAKYNRDGKPSLKDVICLCHPKARPEYKQVIEGTIEPPKTWEVVISNTPKAKQKEAWEDLVATKSLGYMAMLRNLRNLVKNNISNMDVVLAYIQNDKAIAGSKQLPFRFYSAYRELEAFGNTEGINVSKVLGALEVAIAKSCVNLPSFGGRTAVISDNSGSMHSPISGKGTVHYIDVASLFSAIADKLSDEATVIAFGQTAKVVNLNPNGSVFDNMQKVKTANVGHSTDLHKAIDLMIANNIVVDRIFVFSDMQAYDSNAWGCGATAQKKVAEYKQKVNPNVHVHSVDLAGYGTSQFVGKDTTLVAGWSEKVFDFCKMAEEGMDSLVKTIATYK